MIGEHWQSILTLICVAAALFVLFRRATRLFGDNATAGSCGTGGCGSCENDQPAVRGHETDGFVSVETLISHRKLDS